MMDSDDPLAFLAVLIIFGAPVAAWMVSRVLAHQERMEMLRRGITPPPDPRTLRRAMKYGWTPSSTATPGPFPSAPYGYESDLYFAQRQLRRGVQVAFIGFALLIGLGFIGYRGNGEYVYGPWLLGGLIPMFVGIAQIVSAVLSGARLGPPGDAQAFEPPPSEASSSAPGSAAGNAPPPPGSYGGWRPGPTPEIQKPSSPPDYRP
jgi:hypothetical protein